MMMSPYDKESSDDDDESLFSHLRPELFEPVQVVRGVVHLDARDKVRKQGVAVPPRVLQPVRVEAEEALKAVPRTALGILNGKALELLVPAPVVGCWF
jgi:hypothetical protein